VVELGASQPPDPREADAAHLPHPPGLRNLAWGLTWVCYATYYLGRKGFSVAKRTLHVQYGIGESALGAIDTAYLAAYALGQFVNGYLGDRYGARRVIGYGMLLSALACVAFGSASGALFFGVFFCVNGLAQSSGWPGTTRAMAEWTTESNRGTVMAFWATCYQVGSLVAGPLAAVLLVRYGWRFAFHVPALIIAGVGVLTLLFLPERRVGPHASAPPGAPGAKLALASESAFDVERRRAQRAVLKNPTLWSFGICYFFIKYIRYALLFWLPYYLSNSFGYRDDKAALVASGFEVGGIVGVIVIGRWSDKFRRWGRSGLSAAWLAVLALMLVAYVQVGSSDALVNTCLFALIGAFLYGPDSIVSGAAAQDAGGPYAAAMATGFVDGVGSIGAIIEGLTVPLISARWGWRALFPSLVVLAACAALALVPAARRARRAAAA
jgi:sugar phosphate permease